MANIPAGSRDSIQDILLEGYGINFRDCTADEWLRLAIEAEESAKACGPFDIAFTHCIDISSRYLRAAELAEKYGSN